MVLLYALLTISSNMTWITFASIQDLSCKYFDASTTGINMLSLIYMILGLPGQFAAWHLRVQGMY